VLEGEGQGNEKVYNIFKTAGKHSVRLLKTTLPIICASLLRPGPESVLDRYCAWFDYRARAPEKAKQARQEYLWEKFDYTSISLNANCVVSGRERTTTVHDWSHLQPHGSVTVKF
jgi:hypothetical protein